MLSPEITIFDILFILQSVFTIIGFYIAYKKGEKKGREGSRRRGHKRYRLPVREVTPDEFLEELDRLKRIQSYDRRATRYNKKFR